MDVSAWLGQVGLPEYAQAFVENHIDSGTLAELTAEDLKELGVTSVGHRKRLLSAIAKLAREGGGAGAVDIAGAAPHRYTPRHLAARVLASRGAIEGELKLVTVLFADIKGSTALTERLAPEEAFQRLQPSIKAMMDAVHRYDGFVSRVQGDGIMALFGAPLAHEHHAAGACFSALAMQGAIKAAGEVGPRIRVGLHSGRVLVRSIASDLSMDYTAIGPTVHIASRLEQQAEPGAILLSADTLRLAAGFVEAQALGPLSLRGLSDPVEVYELSGMSDARGPWAARETRGLSAFVGREAELKTLERAAQRALAGRGCIAVVVGGPGVGKSRLVYEFLRVGRTDQWTILESRTSPYSAGTSYLAIRRLFKHWFGIGERDDPAHSADRIATKLARLDPRFVEMIPEVRSILDLPVDDPAWAELDPFLRRKRIRDTVKALALAGAARRPTLLVIDDLQWIDAESKTILNDLARSCAAAPLMLLVTTRLEDEHGWDELSHLAQIRLAPLETAPTAELLDTLLGADPALIRLKREVIERTGGTPFFVEETVQALVELGTLTGERGRFRLSNGDSDIDTPATVQGVLAARLDRQAPEPKELLQIAAVFRREVPFPLLAAVSDLPQAELERRLSALEHADLLFETRVFPDRVYSFKHALTHEVAYASVPQDRRRALHARVLAEMEAHYGERRAEFVERLAYHAERGEAWDKAVHYARQAGDKAMARPNFVEAADFYQQALSALGHLPTMRETTELGIDLRLDLRPALGAIAGADEIRTMLRYLGEAEAMAVPLGDERRLASINICKAIAHNYHGDLLTAIESGEAAIDYAGRLADRELSSSARIVLGQGCMFHGAYERAVELLSQELEVARGPLRRRRIWTTSTGSVLCLGVLGFCCALLGRFDEAEAHVAECNAIAGETGHELDKEVALAYRGFVCLVKGEIAAAIDVLERGLATCRARDAHLPLPWLATPLGHSYAQAGRLAEARAVLNEALQRSTSMQLFLLQARCLSDLGLVEVLDGDPAAARAYCERALGLVREHHFRGVEVWILRRMAEIWEASNPPAPGEAERCLLEARSLAEKLDMRPDLAHTQRSLGALMVKGGRVEEGRASLRAARALYAEMGARRWIPQIDSILSETS